MNILMLSWRDPNHPLSGGAEQVMHEHAKGWIKEGNTVTLFSSRYTGSEDQEIIDGVKIIRGGNQYHLGVQLAAFFYYLKNRNHYDFIVDQFHGMPFFTPLYSKKPILAVLQEVASEVWFLNHFPWPINYIYGWVGYIAEPIIFKIYSKIPFMTGSVSAKEDAKRFGIPNNNITIVPHGVIIKMPNKIIKKEKNPAIVFLGALTRDKGIEDALQCFKLLSGEKYQFWIVGKGEDKYVEFLKQKINDLNINPKPKFFGFVSQEEKFEILARASILINPSVREGWGLVNIEANSMGTPVVAYKSAGLTDSVKENYSGVFCQKNNPEEMAMNIKRLIKNKDNYKELSKSSISWSRKFSWDKSRKMSSALISSQAKLLT